MGCVYQLSFPGGKSYIGLSTTTLKRRLTLHFSHAVKGRQGALYNALRKYGRDACDARILLAADDHRYLRDMEIACISAFGTKFPKGYNLTDGGEGGFGMKWAPSHYAAAARRRGIPTGRPNSGWKHTEEARAKISEAGRGRIFSEERRAKIGASKVGNKFNVGRSMSAEARAKSSATQKGREKTPEHRAKIGAAFKGKLWSADRKAAHSLVVKAAWARRKGA